MSYLSRKGHSLIWLLAVLLILPVLGAGQTRAPERWTTKDLKQAISTAKTPQDHRRISQYYTLHAARLDAEAKDHAEVGQTYHDHAPKRAAQAEAYCRMLASEYSEMAQKERELAKMHEDIAKDTSQ